MRAPTLIKINAITVASGDNSVVACSLKGYKSQKMKRPFQPANSELYDISESAELDTLHDGLRVDVSQIRSPESFHLSTLCYRIWSLCPSYH